MNNPKPFSPQQLESSLCSAKIGLTPGPLDDSQVLIVMLGVQNNTASGIRDGFGGTVLKEVDTPEILSENEIR